MTYLDEIKLILKRPSLYPYAPSITAGILIALLIPTGSWLTFGGVLIGSTLSTFAVLRLRQSFYDQEPEPTKRGIKEWQRARDAGNGAAESYFVWGKSFLNKNTWRHPHAFGNEMFAQMRKDDTEEIHKLTTNHAEETSPMPDMGSSRNKGKIR